MTIQISNRVARRHLISLYGLDGSQRGQMRKGELLRAVEALGFVQVDSINVIERAHHHILHSRNQTYRPRDLHALIERDGSLFENWTHDASIIPSRFFPYWKHRFERERLRIPERWKGHFAAPEFERDIERVLERITVAGPVMARDFEGDKPSTGWWDWHPSKAALEFLWRTGQVAIARRDGFQKVYDLAERVIPEEHRGVEVYEQEMVDWACRSALARLGFATRGEIAAFWALLSPTEVDAWLARNRGSLVQVSIMPSNGGKPRTSFAFPGTVEAAAAAPEPTDRVRILSPFDPLLRDRARTERLFGYFYRIEIFVPEAKRQYGYYVYPVLRGDALVGRIDVKADRDADRLVVNGFWPEKGIRMSGTLTSKLSAELERMRRLSGVGSVAYRDGWQRG